jgi:hypothetical protein
VRWKGYSAKFDEWLPASAFTDESIVQDFLDGYLPEEARVGADKACVVCARTDSTDADPILLCDGDCNGPEGNAYCFSCSGLVRIPDDEVPFFCRECTFVTGEVPDDKLSGKGGKRRPCTERCVPATAPRRSAAHCRRSVHHTDVAKLSSSGGVVMFTLACRYMFPMDVIVEHEGPGLVSRIFRSHFEGMEELLPQTLVYDDACHMQQHQNNLALKDKWWKAAVKVTGVCSAPPFPSLVLPTLHLCFPQATASTLRTTSAPGAISTPTRTPSRARAG